MTWGDGGLFIKQGTDPDRSKTVTHEVDIVRFLTSHPEFHEISVALPKVAMLRNDPGIAVFEHVGNAETVQSRAQRTGKISTLPSVQMARFLVDLHECTNLNGTAPKLPQARHERAPFGLTFDAPDRNFLHESSGGAISLIEVIQREAILCDAYPQMRADWQEECLIHADLRWDNCLLFLGRHKAGSLAIRVIDWELAVYGDPAWDLAAWLSDHLGLWIKSIPLTAASENDGAFLDEISKARFPLSMLQPSMNIFWTAYASNRKLHDEEKSVLLARTVKFVAARLMQTAFEWANMSPDIPAHAILAVQMAHNILRNPDATIVHLLGLVDTVDNLS